MKLSLLLKNPKHLIITRGDKGAASIYNNEIIEIGVKKSQNC